MQADVETLAAGGDGLARTEVGVVFVPGAAPGDRVEILDLERRRGAVRAKQWRLVEAGSGRAEPACPLAGRCGGCQWQHVAYEAQVAAKAEIVRRALRLAGCPEDRFEGVTRADAVLGYRIRARFYWRRTTGGVALGFLARGTHDVVDVSRLGGCPIVEESVRSVVPLAIRLLEDRLARVGGWGAGKVWILAGEDGAVQLAFQGGGPGEPPRAWPESHALGWVADVVSSSHVSGVGLWGPGHWWWTGRSHVVWDGDGPVYGWAGGFAQANRMVNRAVRREAVAAVEEGARILELYAGSGNLTWALARKGPVTAVEVDRRAAELLLLARKEWGGHRVVVKRRDALRFVRRAPAHGRGWDVAVLDPPRAGARALMGHLARIGVHRVVYVSCDVSTLARDLAELGRRGYRLVGVRAFDTMPQTSHFELVAVVDRDG